ncbi:TolC family protein [Asticcacaulis sp. AC466]|uniref:TolC family protein n=1 Tax=Asticcacaulis sp. AC466 TaxID=1282362 RepID=UPI00190F95BD|nr:TolC family protein [Asticcacaulis sp. AC466]
MSIRLQPACGRALLVVALVASLSACARYAPDPLAKVPPVTSQAYLADGTARPYLSPVTIDLSLPLDGNAIATLAVIANPDLKALRARADVADAQAFAAGLMPDPSFSLGSDSVLSGPDTLANLTAALGLDLNALRTRGVVKAQAQAASRQVHLDLAWAEWQTAGQARLQAVRIALLERQLAINAVSQSAQDSLLERTSRAAGRGDLAGDQLQTARSGAAAATEAYTTSQRSLAAARFELTRMLGLPPETTLTLAPAVLPDTPPPYTTLVDFAITQRSDLAALRDGYAAQENALHKAVLDQFPALNLTLNANRDSANNVLVGPAVDFTLPLWNRNRGGIAVESATRAALKAEYDARLFQTRTDITAAVTEIMRLRAQRERLLADLPAVQGFSDKTAKAAERGDLSPATAEAAAQALRDKQSQVYQAEQDISELTISLELLTGLPQGRWPK